MISTKGLNLLAQFEGLELEAYPDPATGGEPWTIGIGTTVYPSGIKVKKGDKVTRDQAYAYAKDYLANTEDQIAKLIKVKINQNQLDAILSFVYNIGITNFRNSTLLKKLNKNPNDHTIEAEFLKWNRAGGKVMGGLTVRRKKESQLYFS